MLPGSAQDIQIGRNLSKTTETRYKFAFVNFGSISPGHIFVEV